MLLKLGKRIKEFRIANGLTQEKFGEKLGLTRAVISSYETEARFPPHDVIIRIACEFCVSTDYLYGLDDKKTLDASGLDNRQYLIIAGIVENMRELNQLKENK